jgi:hypothetical protein
MSAEKVGRATSGKGKGYDVRWNAQNGEVYVEYAGRTKLGTAKSAGQAMRMANAWLASR